MTYTTLISAEALAALIKGTGNGPLLILDCSFDLTQLAAGKAQFLASHIPGAVYASLDTVLSSHDADAVSGGRHPLPSQATFAAWLASVGMTQDTQAVVYDRNGVNYCGRLWWMLKWIGHTAVAVLDGGFQAWTELGEPVAMGEDGARAAPMLGDTLVVRPSDYRLVDAQQVFDALGRPIQTVIDARGAPRFRGDIEPLDPMAGHIPGALNRPFTTNLDASGRFKAAAELRAEFNAALAGRDPKTVVHQCGSGVSALSNLLAMEIAGLGPTALYAGSWSDWCSQPDYPVARG